MNSADEQDGRLPGRAKVGRVTWLIISALALGFAVYALSVPVLKGNRDLIGLDTRIEAPHSGTLMPAK